MKKQLLAILTGILSLYTMAQSPAAWTSADMYLGIRKLNVLGSVLYVAAHPDDENTRLIAYFSKDKLYRTGYLSMTRGDGGQNLIGNEQGVDLGLIRTQELLAARRIDGGEQFFTRAYDFGFSKGPDETFTKWDKEKILSDVVWVIRKFQPDVIVTRFPTTGEGGHGHHTASAILANEAFTAAADPKRFPEQLKYVKPWQAQRIVWNTFNFGGTNTQSEDQFKFDVGGYNPLLGKSYGEIAATSRSQHKSQGFGVPASRGEAMEYFRTTGGKAPSADLLDGVDPSWKRVAGAEKIPGIVDSIAAAFDLLHPERSVKGLVQLYNAIGALPDGYWRNKKMTEVQELIEQCSGLFTETTTAQAFAIKGDSVRMNFFCNNRLGVNATLSKVQFVSAETFDSTFSMTLQRNRNIAFSKNVFVHPRNPQTEPYWLEVPMEEGRFNVTDPQLIGQPDVTPSWLMRATITIEGTPFTFTKPVRYKFTDPVRGELYEPLVILPAMELSFENENYLSVNGKPVNAGLHFRSNRKDTSFYKYDYRVSQHWTVEKQVGDVQLNGTRDQPRSDVFTPEKAFTNGKETVTAVATGNGQSFEHYRRFISYDHIPYINYFKHATANLVSVDVKTYGRKIGYITGAGDKVPDALEAMGYEVTLLGSKDMARVNLAQFDAIITGVRAYNTNDWMNEYYDKLMKYVNDGGNLIVQYNTSNQIGPVRAKISPYPFEITRNRVTDENAEMRILKPDHPVLNFPNVITADDFKGWIQERSIYHAGALDKHYETIFSINDPGEKADEGSLIIAPYGKGFFSYTGLVFFRELPAGVPGAYRLIANLIALNKKKAF